MKRLNLGCGFDKREGWVNADNFEACSPDLFVDIRSTPWPIGDNEYGYILMKHVLEHVGQTFEEYSRIIQELYRISAPNGTIEIHVPHYRHDTWWSDPTHVRAFNLLTFKMMSKRQNDEWIANKANYTMLAHVMGVDLEVAEAVQVYDQAWWQQVEQGKISKEQLRAMAETQWGVVKELQVKLRVVK
jgi:predicted SAM-dependent methyltransferase